MHRATLIPGDVEAIERATVAAVSPAAIEELDGWLLAFDTGTVGRAKCAVPLRHALCDAAAVRQIEARYEARGLPALFRIADEPCFESIRTALRRRGPGAGDGADVPAGRREQRTGAGAISPGRVRYGMAV